MKRICIYSFYNKDGYASSYVIDYVKRLKLICAYVVFVANGRLDEISYRTIKTIVDLIIIRPNTGFDAGAYKDVLINHSEIDVEAYDELILCNDTFYGPFIPLSDLFYYMEDKQTDIWGLDYQSHGFVDYMTSMFMAFRKKVIQEGRLIKYFEDNIDEHLTRMDELFDPFEIGLWNYLEYDCKYTFSYLCDIHDISMYDGYNYLIKNNGDIILKVKSGDKKYYDKNKLIDTLSFINKKYDYDISLILENMENKYGINISKKDIKPLKIKKFTFSSCFSSEHSDAEICMFIDKYKQIYIYGAGKAATHVYWKYLRKSAKLQGFIVSNDQEISYSDLFSYPIIRYSSSLAEEDNTGIIIAMNKQHQKTWLFGSLCG